MKKGNRFLKVIPLKHHQELEIDIFFLFQDNNGIRKRKGEKAKEGGIIDGNCFNYSR